MRCNFQFHDDVHCGCLHIVKTALPRRNYPLDLATPIMTTIVLVLYQKLKQRKIEATKDPKEKWSKYMSEVVRAKPATTTFNEQNCFINPANLEKLKKTLQKKVEHCARKKPDTILDELKVDVAKVLKFDETTTKEKCDDAASAWNAVNNRTEMAAFISQKMGTRKSQEVPTVMILLVYLCLVAENVLPNQMGDVDEL